ncbi:integrase arm-type DNA-binding domain-containing protein [Brevundimonas sp. BT-123]|uniref:tyrosine-type recombinase/integrase n=1 Tax=Brevundimonas sp. BT-123 TaxID=2986928 RepID=UPI002235F3C4|nr:integrase arm-type DNA-binding domain-containing protein [Brevundimonas sp. BT-123]MCW0045657.1 integrase arm-type DNA-binding domain-containing protein [Brevundimonas sp. BT-123]
MKIRTNENANRVRLTRKLVDKAISDHQRGKRLRLWDTEVRGLFLQITPAGSASYYLRYTRMDGKPNDVVLYPADLIAPEDARREAAERVRALVVQNVDPSEARKQAKVEAVQRRADTLRSLAELFDEAHPTLTDGDKTTRAYLMERFVLPTLGDRPFREISKAAVKDVVRATQARISADAIRSNYLGYSTANQVQSILRRMYNWAIDDREWTEFNPASFDALFPKDPEPREEYFDPDTFAKVWHWNVAQATGKDQRISVALATMLYLVTLQRPLDVARAHRAHFDMAEGTWIVPKEMTKKRKKPYYIPLSPLAQRLVQAQLDRSTGPYLFPSHGKDGHLWRGSMTGAFMAMRNQMFADGEIPSPQLQLYDGRRFGRTVIEEDLGFPKRVAEHVINHYDENRPNYRYNVREMRAKVRVAQNAWSDEIERMVGLHAFSPTKDDDIAA